MRSMLLLCCLATMSSCKPKSYPRYYELEAEQSVLIAQEGDEAYVAPKMASILAELDAVPDNAREKAKARALVATLSEAQSRVKREREARAAEVAAAAKPQAPSRGPWGDPRAGGGLPEPVERRKAVPAIGMAEASFSEYYGNCFSRGPDQSDGNGGVITTLVPVHSMACQNFAGKIYGFQNGKLAYFYPEPP